MFQNKKKKLGQNLNGYKRVVESVWKRNPKKGTLCVVNLAKIGMDLFKLKIGEF